MNNYALLFLLDRFSQIRYFLRRGVAFLIIDCSIYFMIKKVYLNEAIGLIGRVLVNGLMRLGSIPGHVIPKTQKIVLDAALLNTWNYKVRAKWINPGKEVAPSATPRCSSYWKESLRVTPSTKVANFTYMLLSLSFHTWHLDKIKRDFFETKCRLSTQKARFIYLFIHLFLYLFPFEI